MFKNIKFIVYFIFFVFIISIIFFLMKEQKKEVLKEYNLNNLITKEVFSLKRSDGHKLIEKTISKDYPNRPINPKKYPKTDSKYWFDEEFPGFNFKDKQNLSSPKKSVRGKKVILLTGETHPYWSAFERGFRQIADLFEIEVEILNSDWNIDIQAYQTDEAIKKNPDIIIFCSVNPNLAIPLFKKIKKAGIPLFVANQVPAPEAFNDLISWVGPDDWGNMRLLARALADKLNKKGNYAVIGHMPGTNVYNARAYAPITELAKYAPDMKLLDLQTANLNPDTTKQLVYQWLIKYGDKLNAIIVPDGSTSITGVLKALEITGRTDVIVVSSGHSKLALDYVNSGKCYAITYQSPESEGAISLYTAIKWYMGYDIKSIQYLTPGLIFKKNVNNFLPAEW